MMEDRKRRKIIKSLVLGSAALGTAGLWNHFASASPDSTSKRNRGIQGQFLPEISADYWINADGKETRFSMDEVKNKWVFLKCFQNWCPGCHKYGFPTLKKVADQFSAHPKVAVIGVQTVFEGEFFNTKDALRELQLKYELPIKMGHDAGLAATNGYPETMIRFRTGGTPWIVVANPDGRVIFNDFHIDTERFIDYLHQQLSVTS